MPSVVAPTLASNDAPCSAFSVVYTPEGVQESVEYFARSPSLVIVDTNVVTEADERYLVAGMGMPSQHGMKLGFARVIQKLSHRPGRVLH